MIRPPCKIALRQVQRRVESDTMFASENALGRKDVTRTKLESGGSLPLDTNLNYEAIIEPMQVDVVEAIHRGDVSALGNFLRENPAAARARADGQRTLLHIATDWPGHFPNVAETIKLLAEHGADLNAPFLGRHAETPLHWAASSDDLSALDALLDLGADFESVGSVIGGGTPLSDAVAFGQWKAARRLVERGARSTLWQSAALGLMDRLGEHFVGDVIPISEEVTNAFWCACHGGQTKAAQFLLAHGADLNWIGHDGLTPLDAAIRNGNEELVRWLRTEGGMSSKSVAVVRPDPPI